jgi:hypothetical protein
MMERKKSQISKILTFLPLLFRAKSFLIKIPNRRQGMTFGKDHF